MSPVMQLPTAIASLKRRWRCYSLNSSRGNRSGIAGRIRRYLEERPEGSTSSELAREVLALQNVPEGLAERLVRAAAEEDPTIVCDPNGRWRLRREAEPSLTEVSYLCLTLRRLGDGQTLSIGWAWLADGRVGESGKRLCGVDEAESGAIIPLRGGPESVACVTFRRQLTGLSGLLRGLERGWGVEPEVWSAKSVVQALFPFAKPVRPEHVAAVLGERWLESDDPEIEARSLAKIWQRAIEVATETGVTRPSGLRRLLTPVPLDFARFHFGPERLRTLPTCPGVYKMLDENNEVVYVGKARNLAARVSSYFRPPELLSERDRAIIEAIVDLDVIPLGSELEALLTEYRLIGFYRPRLNQQLVVHPREHWRDVRRNWVIVLPSAAPGCAEVFLLNRHGQIRQLRCDPRMANQKQLLAEIQALFFSDGEEFGIREEGEIAFSWLASRRPWDFVLDVDRWADEEEGVRQIASKVREVAGGSIDGVLSYGADPP